MCPNTFNELTLLRFKEINMLKIKIKRFHQLEKPYGFAGRIKIEERCPGHILRCDKELMINKL